jgi:hypothetical protein
MAAHAFPFVARVTWILRAAHTPRVPRHCPRCDATRGFVSSDKFRVNAHKRRVDVWLVYQCPECDFTWNASVVRRATPEEIGPARFHLFQENDPATAWRCAFGAPGADLGVPVSVERPAIVIPTRVSLAHADPVRIRLDRLLAGELGRSRAAVTRALRNGTIGSEGESIVILE